MNNIKLQNTCITCENDECICCEKNNFSTNINYIKLKENAIEPTRGSTDAAGYDLYAAIENPIMIPAHSTAKRGTGLAFALPEFTFAAIFARSGLATKQGLRPANCVGVCDSDYRGEYIVALHNDTDKEQTINPGDRIAQIILMPYVPMLFKQVESLDKTERGEGGFGSTGV